MKLATLFKLVRVKHWIKNIVVLLPLLSSMKFSEFDSILQIGFTFIAFCFLSSSVYIINDIHDRESDRLFRHNQQRPIASGNISFSTALYFAFFFAVMALGIAAFVSRGVLFILTSYFLLQVAYTWYFKQKALLDVMCIAIGFVLRAASGAAAIHVRLSPWLFICMFTLCLFIGFCKRYMERMNLKDPDALSQSHRPILMVYQQELLMHFISVSAGIAIVSFLMYSISESTIHQFKTHYIVYTLPLQIYCVFRFTMLTLQATYANPVDIVFRDRPLQIIAGLFFCSVCLIIVWGTEIQQYLHKAFL